MKVKGEIMNNKLYMVLPCYNEQEVLLKTANILKNKLEFLMQNNKISKDSKICFVNDGSTDDTWNIICSLNQKDKIFTGINLSSNRGHQNALLAGLISSKNKADMIISMDADLQDDVNAIDNMVDKYLNGTDIVYGVRESRKTDSFFKKMSAEAFYKFMNALGAKTIFNHADFRLMSKRSIAALEKFKEVNLFLRGIVPMIGFKSDYVYYSRKKRELGESKYPLSKMLALAFNGITSFSIKLIRMISVVGLLSLLLSLGMFIYSIYRLVTGEVVSGWTSIIVSLWAIGGLILISIGIVGEYIGKMYMETKQRPRFIIQQDLDEYTHE